MVSSTAALIPQPDHRTMLWNTMLTAEMNVCYWTWVSDRCTKWDNIIKSVIALTASGTVAAWSIWSAYPQAWKVLSAVAAVASVAHPIFFSSERLKRISGLVATWKEICTRYELLWEKDECLGSKDSWKEFEETKCREGAIDETTLPKKNRLIQKAYEHVIRKRGLQNA